MSCIEAIGRPASETWSRCDKSICFYSTSESSENVELYEINEQDIRAIEEKIKDKLLKPIPGTMKVHQLITEHPGEITHREISCTYIDNCCIGHNFSEFKFPICSPGIHSDFSDDLNH